MTRLFRLKTTAVTLLLLLLSTTLPVVHADIKRFDTYLVPDESTIHYMEGFIRAPGSIDLSALTFDTAQMTTFDGGDVVGNDDDEYTVYNDDETMMNDDEDNNNGGGGGGNRNRNLSRRHLDGGIDADGTAIDVAIFHLPAACANSNKGCDFSDLGVGKRTEDGELRWCCSNDAIDLGLCERTPEHYGRLLYDYEKFNGDSKFISIPSTGEVSRRIRQGKFEEPASGHFVVLMANCDETGRLVQVNGPVVWKSQHGYLPGDLFGIMHFYIVLFFLYLAMATWYGVGMLRFRESRIPIEKWILVTICLGLVEIFFQVNDFYTWNVTGYRERILRYIAIVLNSMKHGISRCLAVMVGLGWGVVRDSLGSTMGTIIILGTIYTALSVIFDLLLFLAIEDFQTLSDKEEANIIDLASVLNFCVAALEIIFFVWMLDAMNNTMEYLENMNQSRKLQRYLQLRTLILFVFLACVIWSIFSIVNTYGETGILLEEQEWIVDAAWEAIFLIALFGVAYLWRPNPNAKEYAYVMELPALGADGENDLELTGVVPSAMDDEDDEDYGKIASEYSDGRFKIDEGEAT